ncbi:MAG: glutathione synthetase [Micavibrio sp.]|nr:MAG: glutathione synthetase [Micavibrio sp.]
MKIAFQMESPADSDRELSASLLLMQEACSRGYKVFHYLPEHLSLDHKGAITAYAAPVSVDLSKDQYYELGDYDAVDLAGFDVVFLRQDPPFDMGYITTTYILERLKDQGVLVTNDPFWIRNTPDKLFIFDFKKHMPPTLISGDMIAIKKFFTAHKDVVIKPLYSFHGHGITRSSDVNDAEAELKKYGEPLMFQPFLKEVKEGNKRVVLFDGEIVGALNTIPPDGEFRIYRDSIDEAYELSEQERILCKKIGSVMKERDIHFAGVDFIGPYLTEANVGSVGSLARLNKIYNKKFESMLWDVIERKIVP